MTVEQGLAFLKAHQPMPDDTELSEALVRAYDDVRRLCIDHPDARCIPVLLTSFGDGDGCGVYQRVEDVLRHVRLETVVPHLPLRPSRSGTYGMRGQRGYCGTPWHTKARHRSCHYATNCSTRTLPQHRIRDKGSLAGALVP